MPMMSGLIWRAHRSASPEIEEDRCVAAAKEDRLTSIRVRFLSPKQCQKFFKYAKKSKKLQTIEAIGTCINTSCAEEIAELLSENQTLTYLGLVKVKIEPPGLNLLTDHLKKNKSIKALVLRETTAESAEMGQFAHNLAAALVAHKFITRLEVSGYRLGDDAVASISSALAKNKSLTALDLSNNPITDNGILNLCRGLKETTILEHLTLQNLMLPSAPTAFQYFHKTLTSYPLRLSHISLSGNQIESRGVGYLAKVIEANRLHSIQLSKCKLSTQDANVLFQLINLGLPLRKLWLCDNNISSIAGLSLESARSCSELNLAGNNIVDTDATRRLCTALRLNRRLASLDISRCGFGDAARVEFLNVLSTYHNYTLTKLSLVDGDNYKNIPDTIVNRNTMLKQLLSERTKNKSEPPKVDAQLAFVLSPMDLFLSSLELSNQQLSESIFALCRAQGGSLSMVTRAVLYRNKLTEFPLRTILFTGAMNNLTELDLSFNQIKTIPEEIFQMTALAKLYLHCNAIKVLPMHLNQMPALTSLFINDNLLTALPTFLLQATKLREVHLTGNPWKYPANLLAAQWGNPRLDLRMLKLTAVPLEVFDLHHIRELLLSSNDLTGLPMEIENLTNLKLLDLCDNPQLRVLPWQLGRMSSLTDVRLNSSNSLPPELSQLSTSDLLKHLLSLQSGAAPCYRYRVMLVGQDNVGKTCLTNAIKETLTPPKLSSRKKSNTAPPTIGVPAPTPRSDSKSLKESESEANISTDGLAIHELTVYIENQAYIYNFWDFAGQEVYLPTHNFFLTSNAIYLLAFDMSRPVADSYRGLDYWCRLIRTLAPKSPVILVGTHADAKICTLEYTTNVIAHLNSRYAHLALNIAGFVDVSGKTRKNVPALAKALEDAAKKNADLLGAGDNTPHLFWLLEHQLKQIALTMDLPLISVEQFHATAKRIGISDPNQSVVALRKLSQLGTVVTFRRERTSRVGALSNIVVLDPFWLANLFKSIITTKQNFVENGILQHSNAIHLWKDQQLTDLYLEMLQKFEVIHPFLLGYRDEAPPANQKTNEARSIVPFLLPSIPPDLPSIGWRPPQLTYSRIFELPFLPAGLFGQIMAAAIRVAYPMSFWRNGIVMSRDKGTAVALLSATASDMAGSANTASVKLSVYGGDACSLLLCDLTEVVYTKIMEAELGRGTLVHVLCNCAACGANAVKAYRWPAHQLLLSETVTCGESKASVPTHRLAPDLSTERFSSLRVSPSALTDIGEQIGKGSYGVVTKAVLVQSTTGKRIQVAVKSFSAIPDFALEELSMFAAMWREAECWQRLTHPNLLRLLAVLPTYENDSAGFQLVSELLSPATPLHRFLYPDRPAIAPDMRLKLALDVARGLDYMHSMQPPVIHRDIKSPNVLVISDNVSVPVVAKIIDFGTGFQGFCTCGRVVDNPTWLAVEIMQDQVYTAKADIYSFGVMLWELFAQAVPFEEYHFSFNAHLEQAILRGVRPSIPATCPDAYARLIEACWHADPQARPTAKELVQTLSKLF